MGGTAHRRTICQMSISYQNLWYEAAKRLYTLGLANIGLLTDFQNDILNFLIMFITDAMNDAIMCPLENASTPIKASWRMSHQQKLEDIYVSITKVETVLKLRKEVQGKERF